MNHVIETMLAKYHCHSEKDYTNALKEIFQEIALLGLWRSKFFEHAGFYGGTALRILYGLDRFSEDLDFTLLRKEKTFSLAPYTKAIKDELEAFGFDVNVQSKIKNFDSNIQSAFIKANTKKQMLVINASSNISHLIHKFKNITIKLEIDINPALNFETEAKTLLLPIPFSVLTLSLPDLFAGKIHALLCREWKSRVKGRDWYDFVWYIARNTSVSLNYLQEKLMDSSVIKNNETLTLPKLQKMLHDKIDKIDFLQAQEDIRPFIDDSSKLELWSQSFFHQLCERLKF